MCDRYLSIRLDVQMSKVALLAFVIADTIEQVAHYYNLETLIQVS